MEIVYNIYYCKIEVFPLEINAQFKTVKNAIACCWIKAKSAEDAKRKTFFNLKNKIGRFIK